MVILAEKMTLIQFTSKKIAKDEREENNIGEHKLLILSLLYVLITAY